jgi:DNA helicase-2/ATP-dependent DNA helicase PcrA
MFDFLHDLTPEQKKAATIVDGPLLIIAGAGSGKTRVLTHRIAYLIATGISPRNILALTFTNKAANEMKQRIHKLLSSSDAYAVWAGTFHSMFLRILRIEHERLSLAENITIYDTDDTLRRIKHIIKEFGLDEKQYNPNYIAHRISEAKMKLLGPFEYLNHSQIQAEDRAKRVPELGNIYQTYQHQLQLSNTLDFDDIIYYTYILFKNHPDLLEKYSQIFRYILVDEYQDTNEAQYQILKLLTTYHQNICVVGDDAQSIYAFRGANIKNILNFQKDFPTATIVKLEQNFRSTGIILEAANHVIQQNKMQHQKKLWTNNPTGQPLTLIKALDEAHEAEEVVSRLFHYKNTFQTKNGDFTILYRTNAQSRPFEDALRKMNIPYKVYGSLSFYNRKEIKDFLAYLKLIINPHDEEALLRVINYPTRGIGDVTINHLIQLARKENTSIWNILLRLNNISHALPAGSVIRLNGFKNLIQSFQESKFDHLYELAMHVYKESGMRQDIESLNEEEKLSRSQNIEELISSIQSFEQSFTFENFKAPTLADYLYTISLITTGDNTPSEEEDHVKLMTVHAAKGLEFPIVFIVGLEENLFPLSYRELTEPDNMEEERRLFYVALTRAQRKVFLSYAQTRFRYGDRIATAPSRFLREIPQHLFEQTQKYPSPAETTVHKTIIAKNQHSSTSKHHIPPEEIAPIEHILPGQQVLHATFGKGYVESIEGEGERKRAVVVFDSAGKRILVLKFARLKILS